MTLKIHPAIGVARLGNSAAYYLAPETPGGLPLDAASGQPIYSGPGAPAQNIFHDANGAVKKQGARFKIYLYDAANPADPGARVEVGKTKIGGKLVTGIDWTVYVASKKASWFQFQQLTGSGMEGDAGYLKNVQKNPALNPIRENKSLGLSSDPATLGDAKRKQLILDPGPKTITGANAPPVDFTVAKKGLQPFDISTLGRALTDKDGNLIVLAGDGNSGTTDQPIAVGDDGGGSYANNSGWFDDVCDGPVGASLRLDDGSKLAVDLPAWLLCVPPKFAPQIVNLVSLYDTIYDLFVRNFGLNPKLFANGSFQAAYQPNAASEIDPIRVRPNLYRFVAAISAFGRSQHAAIPSATPAQFKSHDLGLIRDPKDPNAGPTRMPIIAGDNPLTPDTPSKYLTLTQTQFFLLGQFANGIVSNAPPAAEGEGALLDRANLMNCVGGAFCPGIEITWICRNPTLYRPLPANFSISDAFRIRHKDVTGGLTLTNGADNDYSNGVEPGDLTKYMAQPWQADFNECSQQPVDGGNYWWWPAQRPYSIFPSAADAQQSNYFQWTRLVGNQSGTGEGASLSDWQMVANWKNLGFVLDIGSAQAPLFLEIERNQAAIPAWPPLPAPPKVG